MSAEQREELQQATDKAWDRFETHSLALMCGRLIRRLRKHDPTDPLIADALKLIGPLLSPLRQAHTAEPPINAAGAKSDGEH
jgi:hypothetical protein